MSRTLIVLTGIIGGLAVGLGILAIAIWGVTAAINVLSAHPIVALIAGLSALVVGIIGYTVASRQAAKATGGLAEAQERAAEQAAKMEDILERQREGYADLETQVRDTTTAQLDWAKKLPAGKTLRETVVGKREERAALSAQERALQQIAGPGIREFGATRIQMQLARQREAEATQELTEAETNIPKPQFQWNWNQRVSQLEQAQENAAQATEKATAAYEKAKDNLGPYAEQLAKVRNRMGELTDEIGIQQTVLNKMGGPAWLQKWGAQMREWWQSMFGELEAGRLDEGGAGRMGTAFGRQLGLGAGGVTAIPAGAAGMGAADPQKQQVDEQRTTNTKLDILIETVKQSFGLA